jgi:hypothetical protein
VQGVNNVSICLIPVFTSMATNLDRAIPMFAFAETGSQLLTATPLCTFLEVSPENAQILLNKSFQNQLLDEQSWQQLELKQELNSSVTSCDKASQGVVRY